MRRVREGNIIGYFSAYVREYRTWLAITLVFLSVGVFYTFHVAAADSEEIISHDGLVVRAPDTLSHYLLYLPQPSNAYANNPDLFMGTGSGPFQLTLMSVGGGAILAPSPPLTTASSSNNRKKTITYTVREGDAPSVIAASFGITTNTLLWANNLSDGQYIRPGDRLTILSTSGVVHAVQTGDTISSIANQYRASMQDIIAYNGLSANGFIRAGQKLVIPDGELPASINTYVSGPTYGGGDLGGYFMRPIFNGRISQRLHGTNAVDIAAPCWTKIYAAADGRVVISDGYGWNGGYGKYVRLRHPNGVETVYAHAIDVAVVAGQYVNQGDLIAYMGSTGRSTGCHLHWEVWGARNPLG